MWIRCWRPGGLGTGGEREWKDRRWIPPFWVFFFVCVFVGGASIWRNKRRLWVPIQNPWFEKSLKRVFDWFVLKKSGCFKRVQCLPAFGIQTAGNLWCLRRGVKPFTFWKTNGMICCPRKVCRNHLLEPSISAIFMESSWNTKLTKGAFGPTKGAFGPTKGAFGPTHGQGCGDLSPIHFRKQSVTDGTKPDLNIGETRVWRLDSGPNLQP